MNHVTDPDVLRSLLVLAAFLGGILGGTAVDRMIVGFPAWRRVGAAAWAAYSREADLGNGLILYPLVAIGHALLTITVAIGLHLSARRPALPAADTAAALALAGLIITLRAAPVMLGLRRVSDEPHALDRAFRRFAGWSLPRAIAQVLSFVANLWTLARLSS
jgi:hypothetical protein